MTSVDQYVEQLIAAGTPAALAAKIVTQVFQDGFRDGVSAATPSAEFRGIPVDSAAEKRRAYDRERKRLKNGNPTETTGIPRNSGGIPNPHTIRGSLLEEDSPKEDLEKKESKKEPNKRGARIPVEWKPDETHRALAAKNGMTPSTIEFEAQRFHSHHESKSSVMRDWHAAWRTWVLNWVKFGAKQYVPAAHAVPGTPEWGVDRW